MAATTTAPAGRRGGRGRKDSSSGEWIGVAEAAELAGVSIGTIRNRVTAGLLAERTGTGPRGARREVPKAAVLEITPLRPGAPEGGSASTGRSRGGRRAAARPAAAPVAAAGGNGTAEKLALVQETLKALTAQVQDLARTVPGGTTRRGRGR